jgi:hypothetical protein
LESAWRSCSEPDVAKDVSSQDSLSEAEQVVGEINPVIWSSLTVSPGGSFATRLSPQAFQQGAAPCKDGSSGAGGRTGGINGEGWRKDGDKGGHGDINIGGNDGGKNVAAGAGRSGAGQDGGARVAGRARESNRETRTDEGEDAGSFDSFGASHGAGNELCKESVIDGGDVGGGGGPCAGTVSIDISAGLCAPAAQGTGHICKAARMSALASAAEGAADICKAARMSALAADAEGVCKAAGACMRGRTLLGVATMPDWLACCAFACAAFLLRTGDDGEK